VDWWFGRTPEQRARRDTAREDLRSARDDLKQTWRDSGEADPVAHGRGGDSIAGRIGRVGRVLTIAVTLPIIAAALFGPIGFVLAGVLAVLLLVGRGSADRDGRLHRAVFDTAARLVVSADRRTPVSGA
jgi:hypothetical protein